MALSKKKAEALLDEREALKVELDEKAARLKEIDDQLKTLDPGEHKIGEHLVTITEVRTLSAPLVEKKYPATRFPDFYKLTVDTAEVKRQVPAAKLPDLQTVSKRLSVK